MGVGGPMRGPARGVDCLGLADENILSVVRSLHLPLDTQFRTQGFPLVMQSRKARTSALRGKYRERLRPHIFKVFWKLLFSMFHATLLIVSRKYFFGFLESPPS